MLVCCRMWRTEFARGNGVQVVVLRELKAVLERLSTAAVECFEVGCFDLRLGFPSCRFMFHVCCVLVLHF